MKFLITIFCLSTLISQVSFAGAARSWSCSHDTRSDVRASLTQSVVGIYLIIEEDLFDGEKSIRFFVPDTEGRPAPYSLFMKEIEQPIELNQQKPGTHIKEVAFNGLEYSAGNKPVIQDHGVSFLMMGAGLLVSLINSLKIPDIYQAQLIMVVVISWAYCFACASPGESALWAIFFECPTSYHTVTFSMSKAFAAYSIKFLEFNCLN